MLRLRERLSILLCSLLLTILCYGTGYADIQHPSCSSGEQHEFESHILVLNSEKSEGQVENVCILCGYTYIEYLPATGHQYGDWEVAEERPESGVRIERRECLECHRGEVRTIRLESSPADVEDIPAEETGPNQMDYVLSTSIGGVWCCVAAALWYNSLVLNWYKRQSMKIMKMR